jgi:hypothetical protein
MKRSAGSSISRDKTALTWGTERHNHDPSHVDFAKCPEWRISRIVCVSKTVLCCIDLLFQLWRADFPPFGRRCDSKTYRGPGSQIICELIISCSASRRGNL